MTDFPLIVRLANVPDSRLAQLTRELERDLSRAGIQFQPIKPISVPGERGDPITLGTHALALVTSGAVTAMIECFKVYLSRERAFIIRLTHKDGTQVEVTGSNVNTSAVREALAAATSGRSG